MSSLLSARPAMKTYKVLALLLRYPEADWLAETVEFQQVLEQEWRFNRRASECLANFFEWLRGPLLDAQVHYVEVFDRQPRHALYLHEHLYGESRARGTAMLELLSRYRQEGLELSGEELPDHLPVFLEFLSLLPARQARRELQSIASVLALLQERLTAAASPYAAVFRVLSRLAPPFARTEAPQAPRPMEQLLERDGRSGEGREPLLVPEVQVPVSSIVRRTRPGSGDDR